MELKNLFYLALSRYITYIGAFILTIATMEKTTEGIASLSILFIILLINSSIRVYRLIERDKFFMLSVIIDVLIIVFMRYRFNWVVSIFLYISVVDIYLFLQIRQALAMSVLMYVALFYNIVHNNPNISAADIITSYLINLLQILFFSAAGYIIRKAFEMKSKIQSLYNELSKSKVELEMAHKKLQTYADKVEEVAVLNERNRLAGEIHDTIGHSLTGLIMEIDICKKLVHKDINKTKVELEKASELARYALSEVRRSVRAIKPSAQEGLTGMRAIEDLVREFEKSSEIRIRLKVSKQQYKLSPAVEVTIYRTIQEALTNCAKYGKATSMDIDIDFKSDKIELIIKDDGIGCENITKGVGLKTMEERIDSLGGSINFQAMDGFIIIVEIPVEGANSN